MRLSNAVASTKAHLAHAQAVGVDLRVGAQNGMSTDFRGFESNASYVSKPLIAILVEAPRGFRHLGDEDIWVGTLKSLIELHPRSITGLNRTQTWDYSDVPVGSAGEIQQDVTNATRSRSQPVFAWTEKYGLVIQQFLNGWGNGLIMDPQTNYPAVIANDPSMRPTDLLPDYNSMTVCFIEPDPTHTRVLRSWLCCNMKPMTSGDAMGQRDLTQPGQLAEYSIEFTAMTQVGAGVDAFALRLLQSLDLNGMNPNLHVAFVDKISPDVDKQNTGYKFQTETLASSKVA